MIENWDVFSGPLAVANVMPVNTLIGVARLAYPELKVEIQADAADWFSGNHPPGKSVKPDEASKYAQSSS